MKRFPFIVCLCLMTALAVTGCRGQTSQVPAPEPTEETTPDATPVEERGSMAATTESLPAPTQIRSATADATAAGVIYSVPFEVRPDGFSFRNYGATYPEGNFTVADLRAQFGDGVCSRIESDSDTCIPSAEALQWIADRNADMNYGHCIGFTVTSYRFAQGEVQPGLFNAQAATPYDIEREVPIMRTIAANGSLYWVKSVWSSEVSGTPRDIIDALIAFREPVDLSVFLPGLTGGHSMLAYGVEEVTPGQYHILVYDNNFPGQDAFVEVDYEANTWRYAHGAVTAETATIPYEGDASTETLRYIPLSAYDSVTCPFCPSQTDEGDDEAFTLLSFLGQGDVLVKTALGNIGMVAGEIINEIPGARLLFQRGQLASGDAPDIILPANLDYTANFNRMERVSSLSSSYSVVLGKLTPALEQSQLSVAQSTRTTEFQAGGEQSPVLKSTVREGDASVSIALLGVNLADGQKLAVGASQEDGGLAISSPDTAVEDATILITLRTDEEEAVFASTSLDIESGSGIALDVSGWDGGESMNILVDETGEGTFDKPAAAMTNQSIAEVLQQSDADEVAAVLDDLSPVLGSGGIEGALAGLADQALTGEQLGRILQPLDLSDEQLIALIIEFNLPVPELAELLFALRLAPERLDAIIAGLDLETDVESAVREYLDNLFLYQAIIEEWVFLNSADMARLSALLNDWDLSTDQLVQLLPRMDLSATEMALVLADLALSPSDLAAVAEQLGVNLQGTATLTPTVTATRTPAGRTATPTSTPAITLTVTTTGTVPTLTLTATPAGGLAAPTTAAAATAATQATQIPSSTPDSGAPPVPTPTPDASGYPYPAPSTPAPPSRTPAPPAYPYPPPATTATPDFKSRAYCIGDNLRVVAEEPTWRQATIEIWSGAARLQSDVMEPDDEALEFNLLGPDTWPNLLIVSTIEPKLVRLGTFVCPG